MLDVLGFFFDVCFPQRCWNMSRHKLTPALRTQTRSVSGTQKKLKIFEGNCPRQLLKLACTGFHLQFLIVWETLHGKDGK